MCAMTHSCVWRDSISGMGIADAICTGIGRDVEKDLVYGREGQVRMSHVTCVLQCVAVCCSVLQSVAVCCSVLQCVAVCCSVLQCVAVCCRVLQCVSILCMAKRVRRALCCSVWHYVAVCFNLVYGREGRAFIRHGTHAAFMYA